MLQQALNAPHLKMRVKGIISIKLKGTKWETSSHSWNCLVLWWSKNARKLADSKFYQLQSPLCNQLEMQSSHGCYRLAALSLATAPIFPVCLHVRVDHYYQVHWDLFLFQPYFTLHCYSKYSRNTLLKFGHSVTNYISTPMEGLPITTEGSLPFASRPLLPAFKNVASEQPWS